MIAFDELRLPTGRAARVQLKVVLFEERASSSRRRSRSIGPSASPGKPKIEDVVAAMAEALDLAAEQVAARVAAAIKVRPAWR